MAEAPEPGENIIADVNSGQIEWREDMSVGNALMDQDHKILIDLINQLAAPQDENEDGHDEIGEDEAASVIESVLNTLLDYTSFHFAREEAAQEACAYIDRDNHHTIHESLKAQVVDYIEAFRNDSKAVSMPELSAFLQDWLLNHILVQDMAYRTYLEGRPQADRAIEAVPLLSLSDFEDDDDTYDFLAAASGEEAKN